MQLVALPIVTLALLVTTVLVAIETHNVAVDFRSVSPEIRGLVHGVNPYVIEGVGNGGHFLWSVLAGWILLPLAWMPYGYVLVMAGELVGLIAAALLLGVRDWRLITVALAWPATLNSLQSANITVLLLVLVAAAWHDKDRLRCGLWVGLAVAVKLFAWPVLIWLAATKRWRALLIAMGVQVFSLLITLPYYSLGEFVRYEREVDRLMSGDAITVAALIRDHGGSPMLGRAVALAIGLTILWKGRRQLGWVVVATLVLSPIIWLHYFDLLLVPLALWSPPLLVWTIPMLLFVVPGMLNGAPWQTAAALGVFALTVVAAWVGRAKEEPAVSSPFRMSAAGIEPVTSRV